MSSQAQQFKSQENKTISTDWTFGVFTTPINFVAGKVVDLAMLTGAALITPFVFSYDVIAETLNEHTNCKFGTAFDSFAKKLDFFKDHLFSSTGLLTDYLEKDPHKNMLAGSK